MVDFFVTNVLFDESMDFSAIVEKAEIELYCKVALASLLLYHNLSTMDKEVRFFWSFPSNSVSVIYFLNRYVGLLSIFISIQLHILNVSTPLCSSITWIHNVVDWATVLFIDYVLLIRVLALYHQNTRLSILLYVLLVVEASLRLAFMTAAVSAEVAEQKVLLPRITACVEQSKCLRRTLETIYWVTPFLFQSILLCLASFKAAEYWRLSMGFKGFHLVEVLIQDQFIYFGMALLCTALNIVKCWTNDTPLLNATTTVIGSSSLLCLLGSALLINLKEAGERGFNGGTNYWSRSISNIEFI